MSGFGLKALRKKIDADSTSGKRHFIKHLIFGENVEAVLTFLKLEKLHPGEVKILTTNPFYKNEILQQLDCTLNGIRSEAVATDMSELNPELQVQRKEESVLFYKDTKFQKFGGRAKPHEIKTTEKFFTAPYYEFNQQALFKDVDLESLDEKLKAVEMNQIIESIVVKKPSDLVDKVNFSLVSGEKEFFDCEYLYFCESPKSFYKMVSNKDELEDCVGEFVASLQNHGAITVHFECDRLIYDFSGTMFIPQSMTHEWGSFVVDFGSFDQESSKQTMKVLSFLGDDDLQEDDLVKKIKLLKRVIERVFPEFAKSDYDQSIRYSNQYAIEGVNDEYFDKLSHMPIKFIGAGAPIKGSHTSEFQYLPRTLKSIEHSLN